MFTIYVLAIKIGLITLHVPSKTFVVLWFNFKF